MEFYIIIWTVLLILSLTKETNRIFFLCSLIFLILISGIRADTVGTDTPSYILIFDYIKNGHGDYIEPGWFYLNKIIIYLNGNFNCLLLISAILTLFPVSYVIVKCAKEYSNNYLYPLFIYYSLYVYCNSFNMIRQGIAISFGLLFYYFLSEKKYKMAFVFACCAVMFHYSSIVILFVLPSLFLTLHRRYVYALLTLTLLGGVFISKFSLLNILLGTYSIYFESGVRPSFLLPFSLSLVLSLLFIFTYETRTKRDQFGFFWEKIFFLSIICNNLTFSLSLGSRVIMYFTIVQVIYIPYFIYHNKIKQKKIIVLLLTIYLAAIFYKILLVNGSEVYPYLISNSLM